MDTTAEVNYIRPYGKWRVTPNHLSFDLNFELTSRGRRRYRNYCRDAGEKHICITDHFKRGVILFQPLPITTPASPANAGRCMYCEIFPVRAMIKHMHPLAHTRNYTLPVI